jgi:CRISPR/Cas system-associated endonuclease Cas3-HD
MFEKFDVTFLEQEHFKWGHTFYSAYLVYNVVRSHGPGGI